MAKQDFFETENETKAKPKPKPKSKPVKQESKKEEYISNQYVPVHLDSLGRLDAPPIIHVRNYNMDDALELSLAGEEQSLRTTIAVIGSMIKEGFDPGYLHEDEMRQILLTIYANFWNTNLPFPFPFTDEELEEMDETQRERAEAGLIKAEIPIGKIETNPIDPKFKEPIKITIKDQTVYFRLSRLKDATEAQDWVEKKFLEQDRVFSNIQSKVNSGQATEEETKNFEEYQQSKNKEMLRAVQSAVIVKVGSKSLKTLQEKMKYYKQVTIPFWKAYAEVTDKYSFGINPEVTVIHPLTRESVTRGFQFRFVDFLSALELQDDTGYTVEFGD